MDSMDVKGIAWVGNIYQKFEAMCLEVEEAMCQETAKYVENQVQTVGASMKRFCSDVMQDLLPPSSKDLSKVASAELLLNPYLEFGIHMKPVSSFKEDAKDPLKAKGITEEDKKGIFEDKSNSSNDAWEDWSAASFNWEISDKDEAKTTVNPSNADIEWETRGEQEGQICNLAMGTSFASPAPPTTTALAKSNTKGGKRSRCISSSNNITRADVTATRESESSELASQTRSSEASQSFHGEVSHSDLSENSSHVLTQRGLHNTECAQSVGDEVFLAHTISSPNCDQDPEKENNTANTTQTTQLTGDESESSGFEETCVVVDGNDYHPINPKEETKRSYKKKIQGAFSLKKKSSRKQEYKKLVAQHENEKLAFQENEKAEKLAIRDSIESEWELL